MPQNRRAKRFKRRMACEIAAEGRRQRAIVLDFSRSGLFVQTSVRLVPGTEVAIDVRLEDADETISLSGRVARQKAVPPNLTTIAQGGVGLRITKAPRSWYALVDEQEGVQTHLPPPPPVASAPPPSAPPAPRFRVRVKQIHGPRSRILDIPAASADEARARALAELGADWEVVEASAA